MSANKENEVLETKINKMLLIAYRKTLEQVKKDISNIYIKYSKNGTLTYSDVQNYGRLKLLQNSINKEIYKLYKQIGINLESYLVDIFNLNYIYQNFEFENNIDIKLNYSLIPVEQVIATIQLPISGLTLDETLNKNRDNFILALKSALVQGIIQGKALSDIVKDIKGKFDIDTNKAITIVRTETTRARNAGTEAVYTKAIEKGVSFKKEWVATLDNRTRHQHQELDGQTADKSGYFHYQGHKALYPAGFGKAALDVNCRCTTRAVFDNIGGLKRKDNETKRIIDYKLYKDWKGN